MDPIGFGVSRKLTLINPNCLLELSSPITHNPSPITNFSFLIPNFPYLCSLIKTFNIMKKFFLMLFLALGIFMLGCKPDDLGDIPSDDKARVSKIWREEAIYYEKSYDLAYTWHLVDSIIYEKELSEKWEWEGYKPVSFDCGYQYQIEFVYDADGRLLKLINGSLKEYQVIYENERIGRVEYYYHGEPARTYEMSYADGKLVQILFTQYGAQGYTYSYIYELNWSGENLSEFLIEGLHSPANFNAYDEGRNPFYGYDATLIFLLERMDNELWCRLSQNNCIAINEGVLPCTVEYTYDERGFPLTETQYYTHIEINPEDNSMLKTRSITKLTYEYLD